MEKKGSKRNLRPPNVLFGLLARGATQDQLKSLHKVQVVLHHEIWSIQGGELHVGVACLSELETQSVDRPFSLSNRFHSWQVSMQSIGICCYSVSCWNIAFFFNCFVLHMTPHSHSRKNGTLKCFKTSKMEGEDPGFLYLGASQNLAALRWLLVLGANRRVTAGRPSSEVQNRDILGTFDHSTAQVSGSEVVLLWQVTKTP